MQRRHDGRKHERKPVLVSNHPLTSLLQKVNSPNKSRKHDRSDALPPNSPPPPPPPPTRHRHPSREPENHGHGLHADNRVLVGRGGEPRGCENQIGDGQQRPDGGEEHEVDGVGGPAVALGAAVEIDDVGCEAEDDDGEEGLGEAEGEDEGIEEGHGGWLCGCGGCW